MDRPAKDAEPRRVDHDAEALYRGHGHPGEREGGQRQRDDPKDVDRVGLAEEVLAQPRRLPPDRAPVKAALVTATIRRDVWRLPRAARSSLLDAPRATNRTVPVSRPTIAGIRASPTTVVPIATSPIVGRRDGVRDDDSDHERECVRGDRADQVDLRPLGPSPARRSRDPFSWAASPGAAARARGRAGARGRPVGGHRLELLVSGGAVGAAERAERASRSRSSARARRPSAAMMKNTSVTWTNANASNVNMLAPRRRRTPYMRRGGH